MQQLMQTAVGSQRELSRQSSQTEARQLDRMDSVSKWRNLKLDRVHVESGKYGLHKQLWWWWNAVS
jgi:hypothetical protein